MSRLNLFRSLGWALAFGLAGCASAPPYQQPAMAIPAAFKESGPWKVATPSDQLMRGDWWTIYQDSVLNALEARVDQSNQNLVVAFERYRQAMAYAQSAESATMPSVQAGGALTRNRQSDDRPLRGSNQPDVYGANTLGIGLSYEADLWGRVSSLVAEGKALEQAGAAELASVRLALHADLAKNYFEMRALDQSQQLLTETVEIYRKQSELIGNRFKGGIASAKDVDRAQTQWQEAQAKLSNVVARRALYEHAIAELVGEPASTFSIPVDQISSTVPEVPVSLPSTLLQRRPDIAAAERRVAAANAEVGIAHAAYFPSILLGLSGGFQNTGGLGLLALSNSFWSIGPAAVLTLLDGGKRDADMMKAKAHLGEMAAQYRETVLRSFQEVEDRLVLLRQYQVQFMQEQAALEAAQRNYDQAMHRYRGGIVSYLEVIDADDTLLRTRQAVLELHAQQLVENVGLVRAMGGGWQGLGATENVPAAAQQVATGQ
jgi:NodT family efflux transporter outer membrane factor (OMF) lipoprotein